MKVIYNSRPYELSYCGKLVEKQTGLAQGIDFQFGACNPGETEIWYLRDMTKDELNAVQTLFDNPQKDDEAIKSEVLSNVLKTQLRAGKKQGTVTAIDGKNYTVSFVMQDEFTNPETKEGTKEHQEVCQSAVEGLKVNNTVIVENVDGQLIIIGKLQ